MIPKDSPSEVHHGCIAWALAAPLGATQRGFDFLEDARHLEQVTHFLGVLCKMVILGRVVILIQ